MKKTGLGRGLGALISEANDEKPAAQASMNEIDINLIDANPWQPRQEFDQEKLDELSASIKSVGLVQPLTLRRMDNGRFQIIAGERRFRAAKMAGLEKVTAYVRDAGDDTMLELALVENIQRADLNPIEEALSYQRLIDECNLTQETMADRVGKKRSTVTNYLRLLRLPAEIQAGLRANLISMGHARAILSLEDEATQIMLYQQTIEYGYSVRRVEELVREYNEKPEEPVADDLAKPKPQKQQDQSEQYSSLCNQLSQRFGTKVKFDRNEAGKGKIVIPFANDDELERIVEMLDKLN